MSGQSSERAARETKGPVRGRPGHSVGRARGRYTLRRVGQTWRVGTRRGSGALPSWEPPLLSILCPGSLSCLTPQSPLLSASPEMANPQRFLGSSLVAWHGLSLPISQPWHLSLMFRTRQADGVLLQAVTRGRSTITLQVMQGGVGLAGPGRAWPETAGRGLYPGKKKAAGFLWWIIAAIC